MHDPFVQVEALTHRYGERLALHDVTFPVARASLFALLGPNGSGKTTLFKILTTVLTPSSGSARIAGADVVSERARVRRKIGVVFQQPSLDLKLTVRENLLHQGHLYGLSGTTLKARSADLLTRFGVARRSGDLAGTLSGGLQRRVELAKALLHRPELLILDEPSTGLDPGARWELMSYLEELRDRDGVTSLMTTHQTDEAERCDRVGVMDGGSCVALDTPTALKAMIGGDVLTIQTTEPVVLAKKVAARLGASAEAIDGVLRIEREHGHAFVPKLIEACPGEIKSVTVGKPTLEDVFIHLTGHRLRNGTGQDDHERWKR